MHVDILSGIEIIFTIGMAVYIVYDVHRRLSSAEKTLEKCSTCPDKNVCKVGG